MREALRLTDDIEAPRLRVGAYRRGRDRAAQGHAFEARRLLEEAWAIIEAKGNLVELRSLEAALGEPAALRARAGE